MVSIAFSTFMMFSYRAWMARTLLDTRAERPSFVELALCLDEPEQLLVELIHERRPVWFGDAFETMWPGHSGTRTRLPGATVRSQGRGAAIQARGLTRRGVRK